MDLKDFSDWAEDLRRRLHGECEASAYVSIYDTLENKVKIRIFLYGENPNYIPIGTYSTNAFNVTPPGQGTVWANPSAYRANNRQKIYFPSGYWQFRKVQGLNHAFVDLHYTGELERDYQVRVFSKSSTIDVGACIVSVSKNDLSEELEDYYGKEIFTASDKEMLYLEDEFEKDLNKFMNKYGFD